MMIETALETVEETRKWMKTAWGIDAPLESIITAIKALEQQASEKDFIEHEKEVLERIADREREIAKYIKELEKCKQQPCEDVFDKIKAEIESEIISHSGTGEEVIQAYVDGLLKAVKIVDKYIDMEVRE